MKNDTRAEPHRLKDQRMEAQKLRRKGLSYLLIAETLGCSRGTASRWCKLQNEDLEPKKRGLKEKISLEEKNQLILEFKNSKLSVRKYIRSMRPELMDRFSQRTIEKYFSEVTNKEITKNLFERELEYLKYCSKCESSFSDFCFKVRRNSNLSFNELKEFFCFERKSENWRLWERGKKPLKSSWLRLAFLSFYYGWSHGEQMPSGLIKSAYYKYIFEIKWGLLKKFGLKPDDLISYMINFIQSIDGVPRKPIKHNCMQDEIFIKECNKFNGFFSLMKSPNGEDGRSDKTWKAPDNYNTYEDFLDLMMTFSYQEHEKKSGKYR